MNLEAPLYLPGHVDRIREALAEASLDGWLLVDFHGNNPIASTLLGLEHGTRRSFTLVPARGAPVALVHEIEASYWEGWPWEIRRYSGWREMEMELANLVADRPRLAMEISPRSAVPTLDLVPSGAVELVAAAGARPVGSGELVTRFHARWSPRQLEEHRRSAAILQDVAREAFDRAARAVESGEALTEGMLSGWILDTMDGRGLTLDADCIVAVGDRSALPHYTPGEEGRVLSRGQLLLVDLWGRPGADAVFADQTWMGFLGEALPEQMAEVWDVVRQARNAVVEYLEQAHADGRPVRGLELDDVARDLVEDRGYGPYFVHRTGHSIDTDLHGTGPNLDNLETRDDRVLIPGVGFSVEPGVYLPGRFGVRSEIDVHLGEDGPEVTTPEPQDEVFLLL